MARSNDWDDDDDMDNEVDDTTLLRQLRKQLKEAQKRDAEREAELTQLRGQTRERSLSEVLSQKGLPAKVAKLYPSGAEATPEAVDAWLGEFGEVFGLKADEPPAPNLDGDSILAHQRIAGVASGSQAPGRESDALARIASAGSAEELIAFLQSGA